MEPFSYQSSAGTISVEFVHVLSWQFYEVYVNGTFFVKLRKDGDLWIVLNPLPENLYSDDIQAIGDEIEKRLSIG